MQILVTGSAGFIGSSISRALVLKGIDVVGIDNFDAYYPREAKEFNVDLVNLASRRKAQYHPYKTVSKVYKKIEEGFTGKILEKRGHFEFREGSIVDYVFLEDLFRGYQFDIVIHLAAMAGVPFSTKEPRLYTAVNVDGTVNLLNLSRANNVKKFIFASSSSIYGNREDKKVTEEDKITEAVSIYGATKAAGEVLCHAANSLYGLKTVIIRIFGPVYGPLQRPFGMFMQRVINYVYNAKTVKIYGRNGLKTAKDSTYIDDLVNGFLLALDKDLNFEVFNIGTSDPQSIQSWIDAVESAYKKKVKIEIVDVDIADVTSSADISKAKKILGYKPKAKLFESVEKQVEIFKLMPQWYKTLPDV